MQRSCAAKVRQNRTGGARALSGAALRKGTTAGSGPGACVAAACAKVCGAGAAAGGASNAKHKTHSNAWVVAVAGLSSPDGTNLTAPEVEHTSTLACGLTTGAAIAAAMDRANQTSTQRAMNLDWRRACNDNMGGIMLDLYQRHHSALRRIMGP